MGDTPVTAPAWTIRAEQPLDLDQIHELHRAAFPGPAEAELVDAIRSGPTFIPELSLVAVTDDGSVLGHALVSRVVLNLADGGESMDVLALAPIAVLSPHRGRGIGSELVVAALERSMLRDEPFVLVLGAASFFGRFGFVPAADHDVDGPYEGAGPAFQVWAPPSAMPIPAGTVVYPPMFAIV
ncbi:MAG TPA: N-acetyltransferase [Candidatus Limnocylindria bacterium]|nr:N-acetyltransferase [Candidatus Limnocylindria bacterium]